MPLQVPIFHDLPQHTISLTLDGAQYTITYTYRDRLGAWYIDVDDADGTRLATGRRLSPGAPPLTSGPPGVLLADAPGDPYDRDAVRLLYYTQDELQ